MTLPDTNPAASEPVRGPRSVWKRVHLYVRVVLIMCIVTAPAVIARVDDIRWRRLTREAVTPPDRATVLSRVHMGEQALLHNYLAQRSPLIDQLLPAGAGGTVYVRALPEVRGIAFSRSASIIISLEDGAVPTLHALEIHERAHLVHAQFSEIVHAIIATLAPPDPSTYASTNNGEHFAEMAREAWELLQPAVDICLTITPGEQLAHVESQVPGTAGFVLYLLRHPTIAERPDADAWRDAAESHAAPARAQWDRLFDALDARRQRDGSLAAWPVPTMREWVDQHRTAMRAEGSVFGQVHAMAFWPSAMLLRLMGA